MFFGHRNMFEEQVSEPITSGEKSSGKNSSFIVLNMAFRGDLINAVRQIAFDELRHIAVVTCATLSMLFYEKASRVALWSFAERKMTYRVALEKKKRKPDGEGLREMPTKFFNIFDFTSKTLT